ncbi:minor capsid protein [Lysinibacillus piscis]|nr:minor capsid protein [Lysinibacillus sp. KH24]
MERMDKYHHSADSTVKTVTSAYDKAQQDINAETQKIFDKFAKDGDLSATEARQILNEPISRKEWNATKRKIDKVQDPAIKRQLLNRLNAPAYVARITRLEALKENIYLQSKIIADAEIKATTAGCASTINDAYYRTMFDIQQGLGVGFEFAAMPASTVESILKNPWSGEHFSQRVWSNTDVLASQITEVITAGFMAGTGTAKMARELSERMNVGKHAANRLIRTETTYMANAAEMESYIEAEIDEYIFRAVLDKRTSTICQKQDGEIYKVKDAKPGVNMPPMHVFCRSTTRAYFGPKTLEGVQRRARDPVTGEVELIPASMNYAQWRKSLDKKHGTNRVVIIETQLANKAADKIQYEKYKLVYGKELGAKSFTKFQNLKYNERKTWEDLKSRKQQVLNSLDYRKTFNGKFSDKEVRQWYIAHDKDIINKIDGSKPLKNQAEQAHAMRNRYRTEARLMMNNREAAEALNESNPNIEFEDLVISKMERKGLTKEQAYQDIIDTAGKTNKKVNKKLGLE